MLGSGGSHRTHLSRILDLPWLFAETSLVSIPRRINPVDVTESGGGVEACRVTAQLWRGLIDRDIIAGRIEGDDEDWMVDLRLDRLPVPWVVLSAALAVAYNQRYDLLYPGALAAAGIPAAAYTSEQAWRAWLLPA